MVNMSHAVGPSDQVVPSESMIGSSSLMSSIQRSSSTTNMTSWRSLVAAVNDTTAILDSCGSKHKSRACAAATTIKNKGGRGRSKGS